MFVLLIIFFLFLPKNILAVDSSIITISDFSSDSDPEWIQLTNTTDQDINLTNWALRDEIDERDDKDSITLDICISPHSYQIITHNAGWLNNTGDTIYLYNSEKELINSFSYSPGNDEPLPESNNTCVIPDPTPTPTLVPTIDSTITNPDDGVFLNEFMPYSLPEWVEIYNQNDFDIKLDGWKIVDNSSNSKEINNFIISANSFVIFEIGTHFLNDDGDKIILYNQDQKIVDSCNYPNISNNEMTWSKIISNENISWCRTVASQGQSNNPCFAPILTPTPAPTNTPIPTPTPDLNKYQTTTEATASVTMVPLEEDPEEESTPTPQNTPTGMVLGQNQDQSTKRNFLPLILIVSGGGLLLTPVIITKLKK